MSSSNLNDLITYIKLSKVLVNNSTDPSSVLPGELVSVKLSITATDLADNPVDVFVFQVEPIDYDNIGNTAALFSNICSPNDWQELPAGIPSDPSVLLFRYHSLDIICRSLVEADYIWTEVQQDIQSLINLHKFLLNPPSIGNIQSDTYVAN